MLVILFAVYYFTAPMCYDTINIHAMVLKSRSKGVPCSYCRKPIEENVLWSCHETNVCPKCFPITRKNDVSSGENEYPALSFSFRCNNVRDKVCLIAFIILSIGQAKPQNDKSKQGKPNSLIPQPIYFISLVGSDAGDRRGKGLPRKALSFFDVKSEMEFHGFERIIFISAQDLLEFYQEKTGKDGQNLNVYQLTVFFMERNPDALYMIDEVPLIKSGMLIKKISNHRVLDKDK